MDAIGCQGTISQGSEGQIICSGTLTLVNTGFLPPISTDQALQLYGATVLLWAVAWIMRRSLKLLG